MKISKKIKFLFLIMLALTASTPVFAQTVKRDNFSDIRVDALSEQKIREFMREVESSGINLDQIDQIALGKGMSAGEVKKLKARVEKIRQADARALREGRKSIADQDSLQQSGMDTLTGARRAEFESQAEQALSALRSKVFGSDIFKNSKLTFEPNINIATPQNYQVGPDDELVVNIFGLSEANYPRKVSPEGTINIPYAGVVQVAGLSLDEITQKLTSRLSSIYLGIADGRTFIRVTTGKLRAIKVTIIGEATRPGTYTLSSVSTVFAGLYASGGPTENGSYREIEILRGNRVVSKLDVYDFLLRGDQKGNITLRDQDIVRIPVYKSRVEFDGEVKRPRIFEVLPNETLSDVLQFAGGFTDNAYKARVKVLQNTSKERKITDVFDEQFESYKPQSGDKYVAEPILDRFENRVQIEGAVFRPGAYELETGLTLKSLILKAEGFKENAFLTRGYIMRLKSDGNLELISFNPGKIVDGSAPDISLRREDVVTVSSIFDLKDEYNVSIDGEVRTPGQFQYSENMNLEDLILQAGGLSEGASISRIEVARRVDNSNKDQLSAQSAEIFQISIENDLSLKTSGFILQPFDIVSVRRSEGYEVQRQVKVEGEVKYPGIYFITRKNERISDLIKRAGGTTVFAYHKGASLERGNISKLGKNLTPEEKKNELELHSLRALNKLKNSNEIVSETKDTVEVNNLVGIDLERILEKPGTDIDLFLEEGDLVNVPKQLQTVKISGNVLLPVTAIYTPQKGFKSYISESGGFKQRAAKSRSYVKYANGSVKSTKKLLLFFNDYPRITPGSEIVVPVNEQARKLTLGEIMGTTTGLITLALLAFTLVNR
jgi:protein involved in polysaccharide export with SLBB domain